MGGDDANPETEEERHFLGQALAMRAHSYFYLAQYMANEYDPEAEYCQFIVKQIVIICLNQQQ